MDKPAKKEILDKMTKLQAFFLYKRYGLEAVIESYPECRAFVEENKFESYQNVRNRLFSSDFPAK